MTIENIQTPVLHQVHSIKDTKAENTYLLDVEISDMNGERYRCNYVSSPDDTYGLSPIIRQWLIDNEGSYEVLPYVPPTDEERRASMPSISARQLRLTLVRNGKSLASVNSAIDALPDGQQKEEAEIEWEYATTFDRLSPTLLTIANALSLTPSEVDTLWDEALSV